MAMLPRGMDRESPQLLFEKWRFAEGNGGNVALLKSPSISQRSTLESFFSKPYQREDQEQKSCMIIADSTTKPRGFPYPLLNVQVLINCCDNINTADSLCGRLPNVNFIIICKSEVHCGCLKV